jgi:signal transduction histidine kinase
MAASLTHELKQPLFAIRSLAQLALASKGDPKSHLESLIKQTKALEDIVEAVGSYGREDTGILTPVDIVGQSRRAIEMLGHRGRERGVSLAIDEGPEICAVAGEPTLLFQILINLIQNAIDATPSGGKVEVAISRDDRKIYVDVKDTGEGIPESVAQQVFTPFYTTKGFGHGTGLGLHIARELAERCRGELDIVPSEIGATLRLSLVGWPSPS